MRMAGLHCVADGVGAAGQHVPGVQLRDLVRPSLACTYMHTMLPFQRLHPRLEERGIALA